MTLQTLNHLNASALQAELSRCCSSSAWVERMMRIFPVPDEAVLLQEAESIWFACGEQDWLEAFTHHPKIGDVDALKQKFAATGKWAGEEQSSVRRTSASVLQALAAGNRAYEEKFGYIFIVCATGKPAEEMLQLLEARLANAAPDEIQIAMREQNKITLLRLQKLLAA